LSPVSLDTATLREGHGPARILEIKVDKDRLKYYIKEAFNP
jgi:hypothetical protein